MKTAVKIAIAAAVAGYLYCKVTGRWPAWVEI